MTSKPVGSGITSPEQGLIIIDPVQVELDIIERPQNQENNNLFSNIAVSSLH